LIEISYPSPSRFLLFWSRPSQQGHRIWLSSRPSEPIGLAPSRDQVDTGRTRFARR